MLGFFNYTMWLTYASLLSAGLGIMVSLSGNGHPYMGMFFLLFCGLCDAFDGKVARMKKDRTPTECKFGIQIDSLADVIAFGVLPACIGAAMLRSSNIFISVQDLFIGKAFKVLLFAVMLLYILAALIRLAYFNVTEEERQGKESGVRKYYLGLPVTSAAIIFPTVLLLQYVLRNAYQVDIMPAYFATMSLAGILFLTKFQMKKPGMREILMLVAIGAVEAAVMIAARFLLR
jgi:CDP-diacylglycerol--serine O-phosphatidyltransferase